MSRRLRQRIVTGLAVIIVAAIILVVLDQARIVFIVNVPWWMVVIGVIGLYALIDYALNRIFRP